MNPVLSNRGKSYGVEHILANRTASLGDLLSEQLGLEQARTAELLHFGSIYLNHERLENSLKTVQIQQGDYIRVHQNPRRFPVQTVPWQNCIIEDNAHFIVINKPSGLPVHPTVDNTQENLCTLLANFLKIELFITSRLDLPTSGLLVFAKTKEFQKHYNETLTRGEVKKFYRALAHGENVPVGEWVHYMEPSPRAPKRVQKAPEAGWVICRMNILESLGHISGHSDLLIELLTGRTHQIRAQLSNEGHPIVGDQAYGSSALLGASSTESASLVSREEIALQCCSLGFPDLTGTWTQFKLTEFPWLKA